MKTEKQIRREIFSRVKEVYQLKKSKEKIIPGKSYIGYAGRVYDEKEMISLVDSALDFWLTAGRFAEKFEKKLSEFLGIRYCSLVNSGSSANLLAISALTSPKLGKMRLNPKDEVITTACCFPTTLAPIIQNNLVPVFIDVNLGTYNIQVEQIEKSMTKKTKAIFVAHTLGNPIDIGQILKIVKKYNLWFIEDNCDSLGAQYQGKFTGSFGHISTSSFYPAHHITMGEGGAVLTGDSTLNRIINSFRDWGRDCWCAPGKDNTCGRRFSWKLGSLPVGYDHKYVYSHIGYNLKVTDMQAAVGVEQLKKLPQFIKQRNLNFKILYQGLKKYRNFLILPEWQEHATPSWFGFPITVREKSGFKRQELIDFLENAKIQTRLIFAGNILRQPAFRHIRYREVNRLNNSDTVMNNSFFIGLYPKLGINEINYIIRQFERFFKTR